MSSIVRVIVESRLLGGKIQYDSFQLQFDRYISNTPGVTLTLPAGDNQPELELIGPVGSALAHAFSAQPDALFTSIEFSGTTLAYINSNTELSQDQITAAVRSAAVTAFGGSTVTVGWQDTSGLTASSSGWAGYSAFPPVPDTDQGKAGQHKPNPCQA
jgi:hypothetical protein